MRDRTTADVPWWEDPACVRIRVAGVFEGGGAKGIAYGGALEAVLDAGCWFEAVAGASAGAITALMVAAGLSPAEIQQLTVEALAAVDTGGGIGSLKSGTGYFSKQELRKVLARVVAGRVHPGLDDGAAALGDAVTFAELFAATGIELNVVCADISSHNLVVLSHHDTPGCEVVEAVLASSSIPFAFGHSILQVPDGRGRRWHHTLVDGGVSANFPLFVFRDEAFRLYSRRPDPAPHPRTLGFLLQAEPSAEAAPDGAADAASEPPRGPYADARFFGPRTAACPDWEERPLDDTPARRENVGRQALAGLMWVPGTLGSLLNWLAGPNPAVRWPTSERWLRRLIATFDGVFGFFYPPILALLGLLVVWLGLRQQLSDQTDDLLARSLTLGAGWSEVLSDLLFGYLLPGLFILALPLLGFVFTLVMVANSILLIPLRRLTHGLVLTYVSGAGALPWLDKVPGVITLTVPEELTTLNFRPTDALRSEAARRARETTARRLGSILPTWPDDTPGA